MSYLSVNNPPSVNVGNHKLDLGVPLSVPAGNTEASKLLGNKSSVLPDHTRNAELGRGSTTVSTDALSKLLDMFELLFKAMRDVLSGKKNPPDTLATQDKPTETKPLPGDKPAISGQEVKTRVDEGKQPEKKADIDGKTVLSGKDLKALVDTDKQTEKKPDAENKPAAPGKDAKVLVDTDKQTEKKPDAENKPAVPGKDAKVLVDTDKQTEKKPDAENKPAVPGKDAKVLIDTDKQTEKKPDAGVKPTATDKQSNVSADNMVRVNVNVNNCHCPGDTPPVFPGIDPRFEPGSIPMVSTHLYPGLEPQPPSLVTNHRVNPGVVPHSTTPVINRGVRSEPVVPDANTRVKPGVSPQPAPEVQPDKPLPDTDLTSAGPDCGPDEIDGAADAYRRR